MMTEWPRTPIATSFGFSLCWMSLTLEEPMSSPTASFPLAMALPSPATAREAEHLAAVRRREPERDDDLALRVDAAVEAALDARHRERRDARLPGQLRLREELVLAELLHVVRCAARDHVHPVGQSGRHADARY